MLIGVIFELKDTAYSVVENEAFNVTVVKQGNPGVSINLRIDNTDITTNGKYTTDTCQKIIRLPNQYLMEFR